MKSITLDDYKDKYECMSFEREDGILVARIHRANDPKRPVVWGAVEHEEMSHCFNDIARDHENQCVILTGTGDEFIGEDLGGGMTVFAVEPAAWNQVYHDGRYLQMNLLSIEVPMIAAVNGPALAHSELALLCDIVICSQNASFQDKVHFPNGNVPGDGVHVIWPMLLGPSRGRYFLLTGQKLTARQALAMGVVSEVLPKRKLMQRARQLARQVCKQPPLARRFARAAVTQGLKRAMLDDLGYGLALEGLAAAQQMVSRK